MIQDATTLKNYLVILNNMQIDLPNTIVQECIDSGIIQM